MEIWNLRYMGFLEMNIFILKDNGVVSAIVISQGGFKLKVGDKCWFSKIWKTKSINHNTVGKTDDTHSRPIFQPARERIKL